MSMLNLVCKALGLAVILAVGNAAQTSVYPGLGKSFTIGIVSFQTNSAFIHSNTNLYLLKLLYEGWEPLDVMGPYEILMNVSTILFHVPQHNPNRLTQSQKLSYFHNITLVLISDFVGPVTTQPTMAPDSPLAAHNHMLPLSVTATHTYRTAPKLDILLVPGGVGLDIRAASNDTTLEKFVKSRYDELQYLVSVCTGARVLAGSGVLNGKRATTNKSAWSFVITQGKNITWVPSARWTQDGKLWTSSGVAAGLSLFSYLRFAIFEWK
jgi:putative intracellular protease/amidase